MTLDRGFLVQAPGQTISFGVSPRRLAHEMALGLSRQESTGSLASAGCSWPNLNGGREGEVTSDKRRDRASRVRFKPGEVKMGSVCSPPLSLGEKRDHYRRMLPMERVRGQQGRHLSSARPSVCRLCVCDRMNAAISVICLSTWILIRISLEGANCGDGLQVLVSLHCS